MCIRDSYIAGMVCGCRGIAFVIDHNDTGGFMLAQLERTAGKLSEFCVIDKCLGAAVIDHERNFACALTVVDRTGDGADLVRRQIAEHKLG